VGLRGSFTVGLLHCSVRQSVLTYFPNVSLTLRDAQGVEAKEVLQEHTSPTPSVNREAAGQSDVTHCS
jgi:hypothetical protein